MVEKTPIFLLEEDKAPMATESIYLSSDKSEYSTPNTTPDDHHGTIHPDSINQLIASQSEQKSKMGTEAVFYPPTPKTSMISDDEDHVNRTPIFGNPEQYTSQIPQRRYHPVRLCQRLQPVPDKPESPFSENQGQRDLFRPYDLPSPLTSASYNNPHNISTVADGLKNLTLFLHPEQNERVMGCLACRKTYDQVLGRNCCRLSQPDCSAK